MLVPNLSCQAAASNKKLKVYSGAHGFDELIAHGDVFVDKTLFIKEFLEMDQRVIAITRPPHWGKSLNMDMLRRFLAIDLDEQGRPIPQAHSRNYKLFAGGQIVIDTIGSKSTKLVKPLAISNHPECMQHQGQYPVISLELQDRWAGSYERVAEAFKSQISDLYLRHGYLKQHIQAESSLLTDADKAKLARYYKGKMTQADLEDSLRFLSELLCKHFGKCVYILIDEYDAPFFDTSVKFRKYTREADRVLALYNAFFGAALKGNDCLEKGFLTGILHLPQIGPFSSGLNHVHYYTMLDKPFSTCCGFTQEELDGMLSKIYTPILRSDIMHWYRGYTVGDQLLYNPWSIMRCLAKNQIERFWLERDEAVRVDEMLCLDSHQEAVQTLVAGGTLDLPIQKPIDFDALRRTGSSYTLLVFGGYLSAAAIPDTKNLYRLAVPNIEISELYIRSMLDWMYKKLKTGWSQCYRLLERLSRGDVDYFHGFLQELMDESKSLSQASPQEARLIHRGFMLSLASTFSIDYEVQNGLDQLNTLLIPRIGRGEQALVIDYRLGEDSASLERLAAEGLSQMEAKRHGIQAQSYSHVYRLLKVCLAFYGQKVAAKYERIDFEKTA